MSKAGENSVMVKVRAGDDSGVMSVTVAINVSSPDETTDLLFLFDSFGLWRRQTSLMIIKS